MTTEIDIVIQAQDRFSPVFDRLDEAFARTRAGGGQAEGALGALAASLGGTTQAAGGAETALAGFAQRSGERLEALAAERRTRTEEEARVAEEAYAAQGERLLALDEALAARRAEVLSQADARRAQAHAAALEALVQAERNAGERIAATEAALLKQRIVVYNDFGAALLELAKSQGSALAELTRSLGVAEALVQAYVATNNALAALPYPLNLPAAALVLAQGLANVERIRQVSVAHGGLEQVPEDATFLLRQGERVLSPEQNRSLTDFLERSGEGSGAGAGGVSIANLTIHVLENATAAEALLSMDRAELRRVVSERVIPTLDELARLGIRPNFVSSNT
jgi:hypothetical protein